MDHKTMDDSLSLSLSLSLSEISIFSLREDYRR